MRKYIRPAISGLLLFAFVLNALGASHAVYAQATGNESTLIRTALARNVNQPGDRSALAGFTFEECDRANPELVRQEMVHIAQEVLGDSARGINYQAMVDRKWAELGIDAIFDDEVRRIIEAVRAEPREWWDLSLFRTGWLPGYAEDLAERVIEEVLTAQPFTQALDEFADGLAMQLGEEIEVMSVRSASAMLLCLQTYVGASYTNTLFDAFAQQTVLQVDPDSLTPAPADGAAALWDNHRAAVAGGGVLILTALSRQIVQSLGKSLSGRIVGRIVTRIVGRAGASIVPYAGWILGLGLIALDLVTGMDGALPQIESALMDEEVKIAIRTDVARELEQGLANEVELIADALAIGLMNEWTVFCDARAALCLLAAQNTGYRNILAVTSMADIDALNALTQTYLDAFGRELLDQAILNGEFYRLASLPNDAVAIFAGTLSVDTTLQWAAAVAGTGVAGGLARVADFGLYRYFAPDDLAPAELATIITIEDNDTLARLIDLEPDTLSQLLALVPELHLPNVVKRTVPGDLVWLIGYLSALDEAARQQVIVSLAAGLTTVSALRNPPPTAPTGEAQTTPEPVAEVGEDGPTVGEVTDDEAAGGTDWVGAITRDVGSDFNSILLAALLAFVLIVSLAAFLAVRQGGAEDTE